MRPVSGFERPIVQWLFVALSIVLIVLAGGAAWVARQAKTSSDTLQASNDGARIERERLDAQLARERSSREALTLELERVRAGAAIETPRVLPTLTLTPLKARGPKPPEPSVAAQHMTQVIEVRLMLPPQAGKPPATFEVVMRDWSNGALIWSRGGLQASAVDGQRAVTAFITGDVLRPGVYELLLSGGDPAGQRTDVAAYEIAVK